ncbi:MAG: 4-alpha-glucanotransferase [Acidobacteriales bacterium]|nr:4-alpha-glucanotransferase [Terriglobales bacterium]
MRFPRASGLLLHPTSLPSRGGIGDLGPEAYAFVDFLHAAKQSLWQVLPLGPTGLGDSPYSAISAFAGNPLLISLDLLADHAWIGREEVAQVPDSPGRVDFNRVRAHKLPLLRRAATNFLGRPSDAYGEHDRFSAFCREQAFWLDDYALFICLRERFGKESWNTWPRPLKLRDPDALETARRELAAQMDVVRALQFAFQEQWQRLHEYAKKQGVKIVGDIAIFVNYDSADVWRHPELFQLDAEGEPVVVSGVPPDAFSKTGQRWGNPLYRWDKLKGLGYDWWIARLRRVTSLCDYVRLDHFRGFLQHWEIPAPEKDAIKGKWVDGPKGDLFAAVKKALGDLPFLAEDLGIITPDVDALRKKLRMPGMKVLQFGFGDKGSHIYLPHNYDRACVAYTGTHDNDTTVGWWQSLDETGRAPVRAYLGEPPEGIHWAMIRTVLSSPAALALVPAQDVLGLGSEGRMNTPSRPDANWAWRLSPGQLDPGLAAKLAAIAEVSDRGPLVPKAKGKKDPPEK